MCKNCTYLDDYAALYQGMGIVMHGIKRCQMDKDKEIVIYRSKDGKIELEVNIDEKTVWVTQKQLQELFQTSKQNVSLHVRNIFKERELLEKRVVKESLTTASDGKQYKTKYYNLDVAISVGYRVKSKHGTEFRIWATNTLRQYLISGYAINEKRLKTQETKIKELQNAINVMAHVVDQRKLDSDEAVSLLKVIADYTQALDLLDKYDHETLVLEKNKLSKRKVKELNYEEAISIILQLAKSFGASTLFGKEKDKSFRSSIQGIYQTFGGKELYPSIEEKASNLLYFLVKNHSFIDGNKRIAASIFLYFINKNGILYKTDGSRILNDNALVAITLMIAESKPEHKGTIVKMLVNLIDRKN